MVGLLPCQRRLAEEAHWERNDRRENHYNRCRSAVTQIVLSVSVLCDQTADGSTRCGRKPPPLLRWNLNTTRVCMTMTAIESKHNSCLYDNDYDGI